MSGPASSSRAVGTFHLVAEPIERCVEIVLSPSRRSADKAGSALARAAPGTVLQEPVARLALHYAPNRWLLIEPDESHLSSMLTEAHCFEVSGKWHRFRFDGNGARRALSAGFDPEITLANRGCARIALFDCPTIVAQLDGAFTLCVEASYRASFQRAIQQVNLGR